MFGESALEYIKLPSTLKRIEYAAFYGCRSLKSITLPDRLEYIGKYCFKETGLEGIVFPTSLRTVAQEAFASCKSLRTA